MSLLSFFKKKEAPIRTYAAFWNWFVKNEKRFHAVVKTGGDLEADFFDKISPKLDELKEGFYFVTGMCDPNTAELIFTAEGVVTNIVFVEELVASAPAMSGWKITALKPASGMDASNIRMGELSFDASNIYFYANENADYPDEIDITFVHEAYDTADVQTVKNGVLIYLDNLLGELNFIINIDVIRFEGKAKAAQPLIPILKLNDYLVWREKEFTQKHELQQYDVSNDHYSIMQAELENGGLVIAVMNTGVLHWEGKASHPWISFLEIAYDGQANNGMPDKPTIALLEQIEGELEGRLAAEGAYLYVGRQTAEGKRRLFFVGRDFRKAAKALHELKQQYAATVTMTYDIYKDKYWQSLQRFMKD